MSTAWRILTLDYDDSSIIIRITQCAKDYTSKKIKRQKIDIAMEARSLACRYVEALYFVQRLITIYR